MSPHRTRGLAVAGLALALVAGPGARASSVEEPSPGAAIADLQRELQELRDRYESRIEELEARLAALEEGANARAALEIAAEARPSGPSQSPVTSGPEQVAVPVGAAGAGGPSGSLPTYGGPAAASKVFNPDIALIGNFLGTGGGNDTSPSETLALEEVEATFQAVVDPYARADFFLAFSGEGVEIEEGYVTFPTLPGGFLAKAGKLRAAFGKVNTLHTHALPWADRPLVTHNLLGGDEGVSDMGISVSRLIPNPWLFVEATGEVYRGESEGVFEPHERSDLSWGTRLRGYVDLSDSANLELAGSYAAGSNDVGPGFGTRLVGADVTFRWRPLRRASYERLLARSELVWSQREQEDGTARAFGAYLSGEYQFARRWFGGLRLDYSERPDAPEIGDKGFSALLTFWPSEFNQVRGQYRLTRYGDGETAHEFLFQLLFSIGAHGAHPF